MKHQDLKAKLSFFLVAFLLSSLAVNLLFSAPALASAPDELSNEDAIKLLKNHEMFSYIRTVTLNVGTIYARISDVERFRPMYTAFKSMGLIDLVSVKIDSKDNDPKKSTEGTRVSLTEKGLAESKNWKPARENEWNITIATPEVVEIIKIHKDSEDRIHGIEFSWKWVPNKIGEALKFNPGAERAYAKLEPDGKGWRIVTIHAL